MSAETIVTQIREGKSAKVQEGIFEELNAMAVAAIEEIKEGVLAEMGFAKIVVEAEEDEEEEKETDDDDKESDSEDDDEKDEEEEKDE